MKIEQHSITILDLLQLPRIVRCYVKSVTERKEQNNSTLK